MTTALAIRRAALAGALAASALATLPGAASAAIQVANAKSMSGVEGQEIAHQRVVSFDDAGACQASAYAVTIAWGDGQTSAGQVVKALNSSPSICSYDAEGSHVYATAGSYQVTATIVHGAESVTTPVAGLATIRAAERAVEPVATTAPTSPAADDRGVTAPAIEPAPAPALPTTASLRVLGPVRLSALRQVGLRVSLGSAATPRRLTVLLKDPASGRTLGKAHVAASSATVRVHFAKRALRRLRHGHRYGVVIPAGGGVPTLAASFRVA
jgi:hypothetical protein